MGGRARARRAQDLVHARLHLVIAVAQGRASCSDILDRRGTMEDFLRILKQQDGEVTTFSEKLWCGLLDYATAYADGRLTFTFKNGSTFEG